MSHSNTSNCSSGNASKSHAHTPSPSLVSHGNDPCAKVPAIAVCAAHSQHVGPRARGSESGDQRPVRQCSNKHAQDRFTSLMSWSNLSELGSVDRRDLPIPEHEPRGGSGGSTVRTHLSPTPLLLLSPSRKSANTHSLPYLSVSLSLFLSACLSVCLSVYYAHTRCDRISLCLHLRLDTLTIPWTRPSTSRETEHGRTF